MAFSSENLPADGAAFEEQLAQLISELPPLLLHNIHILMTGCTQGALALWREPGLDPEAVAEAERLSGLTEEAVRTMSQLREPAEVGRVLLTAPVRLHALIALGLAVLDTPLLDRFTRFMERPATDHSAETWMRIRAAARDLGPKLMTQFEERTPGPLYDVDDILAERSGELPEAPRYTGEDLHLKRLQIEGHVARAFADYVAPDQAASAELAPEAASERVGYPAEAGPDPADDDPVFQEPYLVMSFLEPQLAMLQLAIRLPLALRLLTDHRFGEAARSLRWLRQAQPMQNLLNRLERLSPETEISFSVADLLRLHQGTQFMALALVGDVMRDLDHFLSQPPSAREDESMEPLYLSAFFDAPPDADGDSPRRAIFNMVEGFVEMTRSALDTDLADEVPPAPERQAMLEAQAEIDDLSSLV